MPDSLAELRRDLAAAYRIVANGITGALAGKYPKSWIKIGLLVTAILILMLIIFLYAEG